jgi:hypothetical protein
MRPGIAAVITHARPGERPWMPQPASAYHLERAQSVSSVLHGSSGHRTPFRFRSHPRESPMMNALPTLIVVWAVLTGLFLALLAYNGTITRYEDNQLFLADINANEQQRQTSIVRRVNKTLPFVRILGTLSGVLTVIIITIYTYDSWLKIQ